MLALNFNTRSVRSTRIRRTWMRLAEEHRYGRIRFRSSDGRNTDHIVQPICIKTRDGLDLAFATLVVDPAKGIETPIMFPIDGIPRLRKIRYELPPESRLVSGLSPEDRPTA